MIWLNIHHKMTSMISKDCRSFKMLADKQNLSEERKKISSTMCHVLWYVFTFIKCNILNYHNTPAFVIIQHLVTARSWLSAQIQWSTHVRETFSSFGDVNESAGSFLEKMALGRVSWLEYHFLQHQRISTGMSIFLTAQYRNAWGLDFLCGTKMEN